MLLQEEVCDTVEEEKCETEYMTKYEEVKKITAINNDTEFIETGYVILIHDGIANIYGLDNVGYNEVVKFKNGILGVVFNINIVR